MAAWTRRGRAVPRGSRAALAGAFSCLLLLLGATISEARDEEIRSFEREFDVRGQKEIWLDVPTGEVEIEGCAGTQMKVEVVVGCSMDFGRCRDKAQQVDVEGRARGERFDLRFTGISEHVNIGLDLHVHVQLPAAQACTVNMGVGELRIRDLENDLDVHLGVGSARVEMPESAVRSVDLHASVGEARLHTRREHVEDYRSYLVGDDVHWDRGPGRAEIRLDVHVGEIDARLR